MRDRLRRLAGFVACLFDAHDFHWDMACDWLECRRCHERRCTEAELAARAPNLQPTWWVDHDLWVRTGTEAYVIRYPGGWRGGLASWAR